MTATAKKLAETVVLLPPEDRAYLAERLLDSLEETDLQWIDEARRRRDEVRSGKVKTIPGPEVLRKVRDALKR